MLELNALDVLKKRKLNFLPDHFHKVKLSLSENFFEIENWIQVKLQHRYFFDKMTSAEKTGQIKISNFVAFEDEKELTYFLLACPFLRRN